MMNEPAKPPRRDVPPPPSPAAGSAGPAAFSGFLPSPQFVTAAVAPRRACVSLCLLARNEEANLPDCLGPVRELVDEIIVVDTGSSDRTRETARALGARVFDFPWAQSFAAARNESLRH